MVSVKKSIRAVIFVICLFLFVWQAYEIVAEYMKKEIATKVTVKSMDVRHSRFNVAYCLDQFNALMEVGSYYPYFNPSHLNDIKKLESEAYPDFWTEAYRSFFRNVYLEVVVNLIFTFQDDTSAKAGHRDAQSMYHPLLGLCSVVDTELVLNPEEVVTSVVAEASPTYDFFTKQAPILPRPPNQDIQSHFGKREAETETPPTPNSNFASENNDTEISEEEEDHDSFWDREPVRYDAPVSGGHSSPLESLRPELFKNSINVIVFLPGQFYMTGAGVGVDAGAVEEVYLHQDVTDKAEVSFFPGEECVTDDQLDEDACLNACLVDKFVNISGCIHPRLKILLEDDLVDGTVNGRSEVRLCNHDNLSNLVTRNLQADQTNGIGKDVDPGVSLMKRITYGFKNTPEERCHCPKPCLRRHFEIRRWKQYNHTDQDDMQAVININQRYYHYKDTPTFDFIKMLADLGGYLGLMLGYSAYSIADLIDYLWRLRKSESKKIHPT